jgi:hypothetical protein
VVESVNDKLHDDLISHDIRLQRVIGDARKRIERRLDKLGSDLKSLTIKIDPFGSDRADVRERRIARLEKESSEIIRDTYREINKWQRGELERLGTVETEAEVQALEKALP